MFRVGMGASSVYLFFLSLSLSLLIGGMHPPTEVVVEDARNVMGFNDSIACFETRCYMGIPPVQNAGVWWIGVCVCVCSREWPNPARTLPFNWIEIITPAN